MIMQPNKKQNYFQCILRNIGDNEDYSNTGALKDTNFITLLHKINHVVANECLGATSHRTGKAMYIFALDTLRRIVPDFQTNISLILEDFNNLDSLITGYEIAQDKDIPKLASSGIINDKKLIKDLEFKEN